MVPGYPIIGLGLLAELEGDIEGAEASHRCAVRMLVEERAIDVLIQVLMADAVEGLAATRT